MSALDCLRFCARSLFMRCFCVPGYCLWTQFVRSVVLGGCICPLLWSHTKTLKPTGFLFSSPIRKRYSHAPLAWDCTVHPLHISPDFFIVFLLVPYAWLENLENTLCYSTLNEIYLVSSLPPSSWLWCACARLNSLLEELFLNDYLLLFYPTRATVLRPFPFLLSLRWV